MFSSATDESGAKAGRHANNLLFPHFVRKHVGPVSDKARDQILSALKAPPLAEQQYCGTIREGSPLVSQDVSAYYYELSLRPDSLRALFTSADEYQGPDVLRSSPYGLYAETPNIELSIQMLPLMFAPRSRSKADRSTIGLA